MLEPKDPPASAGHEHATGEKIDDLFTEEKPKDTSKEKLDDLFK
jgi:hypothetical protein